jgi:hypothetical protein
LQAALCSDEKEVSEKQKSPATQGVQGFLTRKGRSENNPNQASATGMP